MTIGNHGEHPSNISGVFFIHKGDILAVSSFIHFRWKRCCFKYYYVMKWATKKQGQGSLINLVLIENTCTIPPFSLLLRWWLARWFWVTLRPGPKALSSQVVFKPTGKMHWVTLAVSPPFSESFHLGHFLGYRFLVLSLYDGSGHLPLTSVLCPGFHRYPPNNSVL